MNQTPVENSVRQQIDALVAGFDTDLQSLRASLARAEDDANRKRLLCESLPVDLPLAPCAVQLMRPTDNCDAILTFPLEYFGQLLPLLSALPAVPAVMISQGCTEFCAEERVDPKTPLSAITPIGEVVYRIETWLGKTQEVLTWWTRLAGRLVKVTAVTASDSVSRAKVWGNSTGADTQGTVQTQWTYRELPKGTVTRWFGGDKAYMVPLTVHQPRGSAAAELLMGTQAPMTVTVQSHCTC